MRGLAEQLPLFDNKVEDSVKEHLPEYIKPEQARAIFQQHGLNISLEQAEAILIFLRRLIALTSPIPSTQIPKK